MTLKIETHGQEIDVSVDARGMFHAKIGDEHFEADTLDRLKGQIHKSFVAARVEAPYVSLGGRRGVIRGFHSGRRVVLITREDGTKGDVSQTDYAFRPEDITEEEMAEIRDIDAQMSRLADRRRELQRNTVRYEDILNDAIGKNLTGSLRWEDRQKAAAAS